MDTFKVTSWNIKHADKLVTDRESDNATKKRHALARLEAITEEIAAIDADILFVSEGPKGEDRAQVFFDLVAPGYRLITRSTDGTATARDYGIDGGTQWLWFLVRDIPDINATLMHNDRWYDMVERTSKGETKGGFWDVSYPFLNKDTGILEFGIEKRWDHYRQPQVLQVDINGAFFEIIGAHLRSKHTGAKAQGDPSDESFFNNNPELVSELITDRVKLTTECADIRHFIDARFEEERDAAIILLGDLNDGPGKERIERRFMYQDLVTALQGDVFFARRFLNHALFDAPDDERWSANFEDPLDPSRSPFILLDHILFSQAMTRSHTGTRFAFLAKAGSGRVEHQVHHRIASARFKYASTSDHRPISMSFAKPLVG